MQRRTFEPVAPRCIRGACSRTFSHRNVEFTIVCRTIRFILLDETHRRTCPGAVLSRGLAPGHTKAKEGLEDPAEQPTWLHTFQNISDLYTKLAGHDRETADTGSLRLPPDLRLDVVRYPHNKSDGTQGLQRSWST